MNTIETNIEEDELIPDFMGQKIELWEGATQPYYRGTCWTPNVGIWHCGASTVEDVKKSLKWTQEKYKTSWDWLMPVVDKIAAMEGIDVKDYWNQSNCDIRIFRESKEVTYQAVIQFLKWRKLQ